MKKMNAKRAVVLVGILALLTVLAVVAASAATHTHEWSYVRASRAEIQATCADLDGTCPSKAVSVIISAPSNTAYTGSPIEAVVSGLQEGMTPADIAYMDPNTDALLPGAPSDVGDYLAELSLGGKTISVEYSITTATISTVDLSAIVAPVAGATPTAALTAHAGCEATVTWAPADATFDYNTAYTATVTLTAKSGYTFADNLSVSGWNCAQDGARKVLTKTFDTTEKETITAFVAPVAPAKFTGRYPTVDGAVAALPATVQATVNGEDRALSLQWECAAYNAADGADNTYTWTVLTKTGNYDYAAASGLTLSGTVTIQNADAPIELSHSGTAFVDFGKTWGDVSFAAVKVVSTAGGVETTVTGTWTFDGKVLTDRPLAEGEYTATFVPDDPKYETHVCHVLLDFHLVNPSVTFSLDKSTDDYYPTETVTVSVNAVNPYCPDWTVPAELITITYQVSGGEVLQLTGNSFSLPADVAGKSVKLTVNVKESTTATQSYSAWTDSLTFTVNERKTVTHQATNGMIPYTNTYDVTKLFTPDPNAGAATYTLVSGSSIAKLNGSTLSISGIGDVTIRMETAEVGIYAAGSAQAVLTIEKGIGSGSVVISGWSYGETPRAPIPESSTNGTAGVTYLYEGVDGTVYAASATPPTQAGHYRVTATFAETEKYKSCTANASFTISVTMPSIGVVSCTQVVYDTTTPADVVLTCTNTSVPGTLKLVGVTELSVGTNLYDYQFVPDDTANYLSVTGKVELTVLRDTVSSLSASGALNKTVYTHGEALSLDGLTLTAVYDSGITAPVSVDDSELQLPTLSAGQTEATVSYRGVSILVGGFTVEKATVTITGVSAAVDLVYDRTAKIGFVGTPTSAYVGNYIVSYSGTAADGTPYSSTEAPVNAGSYTATLSVPEADNYYTGSIDVDFTIEKAQVTITAKDAYAFVGHPLPAFGYTVAGLYAGDAIVTPPTLTSPDHVDAVGQYTLVPAAADVGSNYTAKYVNGALHVTVATGSGSITVDNWAYGETPNAPQHVDIVHDATPVYHYAGTANDGSSYSGTTPPSLAGEYTVYADFAKTALYAQYSTLPVSFTVEKAVPAYTIPTGLRARYGDRLSDITLPAGFRWQSASASVGNAGTASFMITYTPADTDNYLTVSDISVSVTVETLNISDCSVAYAYALSYNGRLRTRDFVITAVNGMTPTYEVTGNKQTDVGEYTMKIEGTGNFTGSMTATWSILPCDIAGADVTLGDSLIWTGKEQTQTIRAVEVDDLTVTYTLKGGNTGTDVGIYYLTLEGTGNFGGTCSIRWTIAPDTTKIDPLTPENVTSADRQDILDVLEQIKSEEAKQEWDDVVEKCEELLAAIENSSRTIQDVLDALDRYTIETVKSSDQTDIERLEREIDYLLKYENLTAEETAALEKGAAKADALLERIDQVAQKMRDILSALDKYDINTVKSSDEADIKAILADIVKLLDGDNLTPDERKKMEDAKAYAEQLLQRIKDAYDAVHTESTGKAADINAENVKLSDREILETAKAELEAATDKYPGNYTDKERAEINDEIERIEQLLDQLDKIAEVQEKIDNLPEDADPSDKDAEDAYNDAKDAYDDLTDHEKTQVDADKLDNLAGKLGGYAIIEGANSSWHEGITTGLTFVANGRMEKLSAILIDGEAILDYTASDPYTAVYLKPSFLATLSWEEHEITVRYTDGEASCTFSVVQPPQSGETQDDEGRNWTWLWVLLVIIVTVGGGSVIFYLIYKKKEEETAAEGADNASNSIE